LELVYETQIQKTIAMLALICQGFGAFFAGIEAEVSETVADKKLC
jgi:hypothetical protein